MAEKKLSYDQLKDFYERVTESPHFRVHQTLTKKLNQVCDAFDEASIDIEEDSEVFDNLMKFMDKVGKTLQTLEAVMDKLDPEKAREAKEAQKNANTSSLEAFVKGQA